MPLQFFRDSSQITAGELFRTHSHDGGIVTGTLDELLEYDGRNEDASEEAQATIGYQRPILKQIGQGEDAYNDVIAYAER